MSYPHQPSLWDKAKMGLLMGGTVGACLGCLIGIYSTMKFGPGPRGYLGTIGQYALGSGASFGFFMSIGSCIRNEEESAASNLSLADKKTLNQKFRSSYYHHNNNNPNPIAAYYYNPANNMNSSPSSS